MGRAFQDENGNFSPVPFGQYDAKRLRYPRYHSGEVCPDCKNSSVRYTKTGKCVHCSLLAAIDLRAYAVGVMSFLELPDGSLSTSFSVGIGGDRDDITPEYQSEIIETATLLGPDRPAPLNAAEARERGLELWVREMPCSKAGHLGVRTLKGECYFCAVSRGQESPRQRALRAGKTWYTPTHPCKRCGEIADRNVHTGACQGCIPDDKRKTPDSELMNQTPDLIISRADAEAHGLKVYRTGRPCRRGHTGFRYVSTGNCIPCLRG